MYDANELIKLALSNEIFGFSFSRDGSYITSLQEVNDGWVCTHYKDGKLISVHAAGEEEIEEIITDCVEEANENPNSILTTMCEEDCEHRTRHMVKKVHGKIDKQI